MHKTKTIKIKHLSSSKMVWCRIADSPLYWHRLKVDKLYHLNGYEFAICPVHVNEIILLNQNK